jgi:hypothetical protein
MVTSRSIHTPISAALANTNGTITLNHAHIGGGVATSNGDVTIGEGSRVDGGHRRQRSTSDRQLGPIVIRKSSSARMLS